MDHARFGPHKIWTTQGLDHIKFGSYKDWIVQGLDCARFGSCKVWIVQDLEDARFGYPLHTSVPDEQNEQNKLYNTIYSPDKYNLLCKAI